MLPKVATHLLHSTVTRSAAAAVQNQSSLRNVLQKHPSGSTPGSSASASTFAGSSTTTNTTFTSNQHLASSSAAGVGASSSSSAHVNSGFFTSNATSNGKSRAISTEEAKANAHGGSHGPGSGQGAKKNKAGSRFYTGYNGAARAVTQANALTSQDGSSSQADESTAGDESMHPAARRALLKKKNIAVGASATPKRTRLRSSSVNSLLPRKDGAHSSESTVPVGSVLKTVQLQARSLHALTAAQQQQQQVQESTEAQSSSIEAEAATAAEVVQDLSTAPEPPVAAQEVRVASRSASPVRPISPRPRRNSTSSHVSLPSSPIVHPADIPLPASPVLSVRHSSTVAGSASEPTAAVEEVSEATESSSPAPSLEAASEEPTATAALSSPRRSRSPRRTSTPPPPRSAEADVDGTPRPAPPAKKSQLTSYGENILAGLEANDPSSIFAAVHALHTAPPHARISIPDFNVAIETLGKIRPQGQPIKRILDVYSTMLSRSCRPNLRTYLLLLQSFTERDRDAGMFKDILATRGALLSPEERAEIEEQIKKVEEERNLGGAMKVFEAIVGVEGGNERLEPWVYKNLMRSSAMHGNVGVALRVLSMVEQRQWLRNPEHFRYLIQAFANSGDFKGAELVFEKYRKAEESGMLHRPESVQDQLLERRRVQVWNEMVGVYFRKGEPERAIEVLELMLKSSAAAKASSTAAEPIAAESEAEVTASAEESEGFPIPAPTSSTFTTIISGFINHSQDLSSALLWFNRLLQEPDAKMKPDAKAGAVLLNALAESGRVEELNQLYESLLVAQKRVEPAYKGLVFSANLRSALNQEVAKDQALERVGFVRRHLESEVTSSGWVRHNQRVVYDVCDAYVALGEPHEATAFLQTVVRGALQQQQQPPSAEQAYPDFMDVGVVEVLQGLVGSVTERIVSSTSSVDWAFEDSMELAKLGSEQLGMRILPQHAAWLVHSYSTTRPTDLSMESWRILLSSAVYLESNAPAPIDNTPTGLASLLEDMASANVPFSDELCDEDARVSIVDLVSRGRDVEWCREFFGRLGAGYWESYERVVNQRYSEIEQKLNEATATTTSSPPAPSSPTYSYYNQSNGSNSYVSNSPPLSPPAPPPPVFAMTSKFGGKLYQNRAIAKELDRLLKDASRPLEERVDEAYNVFQASFQVKGVIPATPTLARFIQACGRAGQLDRVNELYAVATALVESLKDRSPGQGGESKASAWVKVEDSMIVALAQAGDVEGAHVHRRRIVEFANRVNAARSKEGGVVYAPSSDAYGALIYNVKDTTDDATNALMLWTEAVELGVEPNLYLYNNIISKLARARKADQALELFKQMKERGLSPSSITYGAMIGACVRVGDVSSAEALFNEMETQRNFKPRVPPFNTMMQLYTTTKPNRERALWFYEEMGRQGVEPTAHTYKLLLDVYGSVEPVDIASMEYVFENLKADPSVAINGTHIASLINAYGCVLKDLDQAIAVFESVPVYNVSRDAVIYEALVNALVANKRTDLIRGYIKRMMDDGVHMTAYVANFLIKGYANVGDIEQARVVFESMMDPPMGVAAPNNHAPHEPGVTLGHVGVMEPVYREPSTWEAMVRAELGAGNRDRAVSLLERLRARQYPEAVFNRISGVMVDHSMPPLL